MSQFDVLKQSPLVAQMDVAGRLNVALLRIKVLQDLVHRLGARAIYVADRLEDHGDLVLLGSSNDADVLRRAKEIYDEYRFETDEMGPEDALLR